MATLPSKFHPTENVRLTFLKPSKVEVIHYDDQGNETSVDEREFFQHDGVIGQAFRDGDTWHFETPFSTMVVPTKDTKAMKMFKVEHKVSLSE